MNFVREHWTIIWTVITTLFSVVVCFLAKTYARRDDLVALSRRVDSVEQKLDSIPTRNELHELKLQIESLRGDIREITPQLKQIKHINDLLLSNELKGTGK